jgi:CHRD domain
MRSKILIGTALVGICVAGCGGGGSGAGGATHRAAVPGSSSRPTQIFRVRMSGAIEIPPGAKHGAGAAVIAFHGASMVCWRFAHLHGFTDATSARVETGAAGRAGQSVIVLSPGPRLHHQGCVTVSPALTSRIVARPGGYYVDIQSKQYPQGAVRAQL